MTAKSYTLSYIELCTRRENMLKSDVVDQFKNRILDESLDKNICVSLHCYNEVSGIEWFYREQKSLSHSSDD